MFSPWTNSTHFNRVELLKGSAFQDDVPFIVDRFDKRTKHAFRSDGDVQYVRFASHRENAPDVGIRFGQLKLGG